MWLDHCSAPQLMDTYSGKIQLANGKMIRNKSYLEHLTDMNEFPAQSFYQIQLDVPRMALPDTKYGDPNFDKRAAATKLFYNYAKRNAVSNYV